MTLVLTAAPIIAIVGMILYILPTSDKVQKLGLIAYGAGLLAFLINLPLERQALGVVAEARAVGRQLAARALPLDDEVDAVPDPLGHRYARGQAEGAQQGVLLARHVDGRRDLPSHGIQV
jgi:hypothetical protein